MPAHVLRKESYEFIFLFLALSLFLLFFILPWEADSLRNAVVLAAASLSTSALAPDTPPIPLPLLLATIFIGGCVFSTAGGFKVLRFGILVRHCLHELSRLVNPKRVDVMVYGKEKISPEGLSHIGVLFICHMGFLAFGILAMGISGVPLESAFPHALASLVSAGGGLESLGQDVIAASDLPSMALWVSCSLMILGRIEMVAFLLILTHAFWRNG